MVIRREKWQSQEKKGKRAGYIAVLPVENRRNTIKPPVLFLPSFKNSIVLMFHCSNVFPLLLPSVFPVRDSYFAG